MKLATANTSKRRLSSEDTLALWKEYRRTDDRAVRDRLVLTFAPLVKYIVYKKVREMPARCEVEDFISCGLEALIQSIERYDPAKGATLEQYAWTRIHGAVLDELRRQDWAPRSVRRWERDIERAADEFTTLHGRRPTQRGAGRGAWAPPSPSCASAATRSPQSDLTSLNTLVLSDDETTIERIDTIASTDVSADPLHAAAKEQAKDKFREAFAAPAPARARGRRPALRQEHDAGRDRRDPRRQRVARLPDPRPAEEDAAHRPRRRRTAVPGRRLSSRGRDTAAA